MRFEVLNDKFEYDPKDILFEKIREKISLRESDDEIIKSFDPENINSVEILPLNSDLKEIFDVLNNTLMNFLPKSVNVSHTYPTIYRLLPFLTEYEFNFADPIDGSKVFDAQITYTQRYSDEVFLGSFFDLYSGLTFIEEDQVTFDGKLNIETLSTAHIHELMHRLGIRFKEEGKIYSGHTVQFEGERMKFLMIDEFCILITQGEVMTLIPEFNRISQLPTLVDTRLNADFHKFTIKLYTFLSQKWNNLTEFERVEYISLFEHLNINSKGGKISDFIIASRLDFKIQEGFIDFFKNSIGSEKIWNEFLNDYFMSQLFGDSYDAFASILDNDANE